MQNKEPKTQGKIEDWFLENVGDARTIERAIAFDNLMITFQQEQQALLQRVIELIGEDEPVASKGHRYWKNLRNKTRNTLRHELKSKISQMGEEYGKD